nr:MAG TPA: hypothetical protein [Caudoviricetes sp.]
MLPCSARLLAPDASFRYQNETKKYLCNLVITKYTCYNITTT